MGKQHINRRIGSSRAGLFALLSLMFVLGCPINSGAQGLDGQLPPHHGRRFAPDSYPCDWSPVKRIGDVSGYSTTLVQSSTGKDTLGKSVSSDAVDMTLVRVGRPPYTDVAHLWLPGRSELWPHADFYIGTFEVTTEEYDRYRLGGSRNDSSHGDVAATGIGWLDSIQYANWLSEVHGLDPAYTVSTDGVAWDRSSDGYRLPTAAEWRYAYQGGIDSRGYSFAGGDVAAEVGWTAANSGGRLHRVGLLLPNELGIYDLVGNIAEWVWDAYDHLEERADAPLGRVYAVALGGDFMQQVVEFDVAVYLNGPDVQCYTTGIRLARNAARP